MSFAGGTDPGPEPPAMAPEPAATPASAPPSSALFGSVAPADLTLGTAIEVAFKALGKVAFLGPILVISIVINAILELALGDSLRSMGLTPGTRPTIEDVNRILGAAGLSFVVSFFGGIIVAIYGQVWAIAASVGPFPTIGETLRLAGRRWLSILGASLLVGVINVGLVLLAAVVVGLLAGFSAAIAFGVAVGLVIAFIWFIARLSMAPWLAADGTAAVASVQGSWRITENQVLRIVGWSFAYGMLIVLLAGALGLALGRVPLIGAGIAQGLSLALGYAAGVTLFRRTQAGYTPPAVPASAPSVTDSTIG
jgi:hypothetical protein